MVARRASSPAQAPGRCCLIVLVYGLIRRKKMNRASVHPGAPEDKQAEKEAAKAAKAEAAARKKAEAEEAKRTAAKRAAAEAKAAKKKGSGVEMVSSSDPGPTPTNPVPDADGGHDAEVRSQHGPTDRAGGATPADVRSQHGPTDRAGGAAGAEVRSQHGPTDRAGGATPAEVRSQHGPTDRAGGAAPSRGSIPTRANRSCSAEPPQPRFDPNTGQPDRAGGARAPAEVRSQHGPTDRAGGAARAITAAARE